MFIKVDIYQEESFILNVINSFRVTVNTAIFHDSTHLESLSSLNSSATKRDRLHYLHCFIAGQTWKDQHENWNVINIQHITINNNTVINKCWYSGKQWEVEYTQYVSFYVLFWDYQNLMAYICHSLLREVYKLLFYKF